VAEIYRGKSGVSDAGDRAVVVGGEGVR
jgi:hypothetical protein